MWSSEMELIVNVPRKALTLFAGIGLVTALSACASAGGPVGPEPLTPTQQFTIDVKQQPQEMRLAVHGAGVSQNQAHVLSAFAHQWVQSERGVITLQSPARASDAGAAYRTATGARDVLVASGVSPDKIRIVSYEPAADAAEAPVIVGFVRYVAEGPKCGQAWENLTATAQNRATAEFGCAVTANIAAEIGDPADLVQPRELAPADAARRQAVLDRYRQGAVTSSAKDNQADGAISKVVP